jgi:hypothetical protein
MLHLDDIGIINQCVRMSRSCYNQSTVLSGQGHGIIYHIVLGGLTRGRFDTLQYVRMARSW